MVRPGQGARGATVVLGVAALVVAILSGIAPAGAAPGPRHQDLRHARASVHWVDCKPVHPRCGYVTVPLDRHDASLGTIKIFFELYPHRDTSQPPLETIVSTEGGPGYSTTGSRWWYRDLFKPLMNRHDLLLVDNRGTGKSAPIDCKRLQSYVGSYDRNVGRCGRQLGDAADLYGTHNAVDDLAAVLASLKIDSIDLYGDSYGTFFGQTFAVRHPDLLRSLVLDSAYFVQWPDPWYSDTNRAMVDIVRRACERWPTCAARGDAMDRIQAMLDTLRAHPIVGDAYDGDGVLHHLTFGPGELGQVMSDGATNPVVYRELDAAIRAALGPEKDTAPLLRLLAENTWWGDGGAVRQWSEGLYDAVACNDYPQPYDMTAGHAARVQQYRASIKGLEADDPGIFAPFTVKEWVHYPDHYWDSCLRWPRPSRIDPPLPPHAQYPDVPVLVLSSDLDSLTSPEGARATAAAFPDSTFVSVANSTHVSALADYNRCASVIVRRFVQTLSAGDTSCAAQYSPVRLVDTFAEHAGDLGIGNARRRSAVVAADTVGDAVARWWADYAGHGVGLRGGTFTTRGYSDVFFRLHDYRWVDDVAVNGHAEWDRATGLIRATVSVSGAGGASGTLKMSWYDWEQQPQALVRGTLDGQHVSYSFLAP
jgi:pimeloyl-ACP methyl ester carboxylesterase